MARPLRTRNPLPDFLRTLVSWTPDGDVFVVVRSTRATTRPSTSPAPS